MADTVLRLPNLSRGERSESLLLNGQANAFKFAIEGDNLFKVVDKVAVARMPVAVAHKLNLIIIASPKTSNIAKERALWWLPRLDVGGSIVGPDGGRMTVWIKPEDSLTPTAQETEDKTPTDSPFNSATATPTNLPLLASPGESDQEPKRHSISTSYSDSSKPTPLLTPRAADHAHPAFPPGLPWPRSWRRVRERAASAPGGDRVRWGEAVVPEKQRARARSA